MFRPVHLFALILLLVSSNVSAQKTAAELPKFKFGKITAADFDTKPFGADSAAAAVKICDVGKGSFEISTSTGSFIYVFERHVRYKIINKNAYDLANMELQLYRSDNGGEEKLSFINGATYNMVDDKIITSKIGSDAKFSSKLDRNHIIKKFTLPNVKEGSVIEFDYKTTSEFIFKIDDWYFQDNYPCKYSYFSFTVPEYYNYKLDVRGFVDLMALKEVETTKGFYIPSTNTSSAGTINAKTVQNQYYAQNIPAIKTENYITTLEDYICKIGFELTSTNFPSSGYKDYSSTWQKIISEMMDDENFGGFIRKDNYSKDLVSGILGKETDPVKKMDLLFNYVKKNIKWDGQYSDFAKATSQRTVLEKKSGNSAEINLILMGMLSKAGLDSYPVLISTRKNGAHPGYPLATKFNNVIVLVEMDSVKHLLDATDKNNVNDLISYQNLNHKGLKIDMGTKDGAWISTENTSLSRTNLTYNVKLGTDNKLSGTLYISTNNYAGLERRNSYQTATNEAEFIKLYKSTKPGLEISNYKIQHVDEPGESLEESMDISIEDNIEEAGNLAYFMPLLFERTKENPFLLEDRKFPVDFAYPIEENYRIMIEFPASYKLDKLPKSQKFALPNNDGSFTITYAQENNKIAVRSKINITKSSFTADEYYNLKELFKNIVSKQAEQVVFSKI